MKPVKDRRSDIRKDQPATVFIETSAEAFDKSIPANVIRAKNIDLSENGIKVELNQAVPIGSVLRLCIELHPEDQPLYLVGEVKWIQPHESFHRIGFELYDAEKTDIEGWQQTIKELINRH